MVYSHTDCFEALLNIFTYIHMKMNYEYIFKTDEFSKYNVKVKKSNTKERVLFSE